LQKFQEIFPIEIFVICLSPINTREMPVEVNSKPEDNKLIQFVLIDCKEKIFLPKLRNLTSATGITNDQSF